MARLKWLIIPIFAILLMSHNAGAVSTSFDVSNYDNIQQVLRVPMYCKIDDNVSTAQSYCSATGAVNHNVYDLYSSSTYSLKKGDIVEFDLIVLEPLNTFWEANQFGFVNFQAVGSNFTLLSFEDVSNYYSSDYFSMNLSDGFINGGSYNSKVVHFSLMVLRDFTDKPIGFSTTNNNYPILVYNGEFLLKFINLNIYRKSDAKTESNQEQEQAAQEQSEAGDSAADSSTDAVEGATQNLFSAMGSIVNAVKDTPATNCLIDISTTGNSSAFTSAIGSINLCADVPSNILNMVRGLAALVIVPYVLYACYSICIKMYRTFTEVQNT